MGILFGKCVYQKLVGILMLLSLPSGAESIVEVSAEGLTCVAEEIAVAEVVHTKRSVTTVRVTELLKGTRTTVGSFKTFPYQSKKIKIGEKFIVARGKQGERWGNTNIYLRSSWGMPTRDQRIIHGMEIVTSIKQYLGKKKPWPCTKLHATEAGMGSRYYRARYSGSVVTLLVPVDEVLLAEGTRLSSSRYGGERLQATRILSHFKKLPTVKKLLLKLSQDNFAPVSALAKKALT